MKQYVVTAVDARRTMARYVSRQKASYSGADTVYHGTLRCFLDSAIKESRTTGHLILDETCIVRWMIKNARGQSVKYAGQRFAVLGHYMRALVEDGVIGSDLVGDFRKRHRGQSWGALVEALQSRDPAAALAALKPATPLPGPLDLHITRFIQLGRAMGKRYKHQLRILQELDQFLDKNGVSSPQSVCGHLLQQWMEVMSCSPGVRVNKIRFVRRFFDYLRGIGAVTQNPVSAPLASWKPPTTFRPFIFTKDQVATILEGAQVLPKSPRFPLRSQTCHAMFAALYCLGLRHGEACRLRIRDVDLKRNTVFIDKTKFNKSRYAPFGPKLGQCLREYFDARQEFRPTSDTSNPFFVTWGLAPMGMGALRRAFHALLETTGIAEIPRPRLHDLRHTFAVHRLLRWYQEDADVQQKLPWLSTFMGHVDIQSTQVYLTITADLLKEANDRFYQHCGHLAIEEDGS